MLNSKKTYGFGKIKLKNMKKLLTARWIHDILSKLPHKNAEKHGNGRSVFTGWKKRLLPCRNALHIPNLIWEPDRNATLNIFLSIWGQLMTNGLLLRDRAQEAKNMILTDHDEEIQRTWIVGKEFERSSDFRTTQFSKRIKMESQVHFDRMNFFHIKIKTFLEGDEKF